MSIVNVSLKPTSALVAVDTEMVAATDGTRGHGSKLLALPHLHSVLAFRGALPVFGVMFMMLHMSIWEDLDALLDLLPEILPGAVEAARATVQADPRFAPPNLAVLEIAQLAVIGWSLREDRMVGRVFTQAPPAKVFLAESILDYFIAPFDASIEDLPDPDTPAAMERLARAQVQLIKTIEPAAAGGGRLILAEITRRDITITKHCNLHAAPERHVLPLTRKIGPVRVSGSF